MGSSGRKQEGAGKGKDVELEKGGSLNSADLSDAPLEEGTIKVQVNDPVRQGEGVNQFISFSVHTVSTLDPPLTGRRTVVRRFSDFLWLAASLSSEKPGCVLPPLPERTATAKMFRMSSPFVERRRLSLERFLQRTADHPELRQSDALRIFLEARGSVGETDESATQSHLRSWRERVPNSVASVRLTPLLMVALSHSSNAFAFLVHVSINAADAGHAPKHSSLLEQKRTHRFARVGQDTEVLLKPRGVIVLRLYRSFRRERRLRSAFCLSVLAVTHERGAATRAALLEPTKEECTVAHWVQ